MRKSRDIRLFLVTELLLGILVGVFIMFLFYDKGNEDKIAVIFSNPGDGKWEACIEGIKRCAKNSGTDVVICNAIDLNKSEELKNLIEEQIKSGANALIIQDVPKGDSYAVVSSFAKDIPVVILEKYDNSEENKIATVGPDNYEIGKALAKCVIDDYAGNLSGKTVGIVMRSFELESDSDREQGFRDAMKETEAHIMWSFAEDLQKDGINEIKKYIADHKKVNVIVALDSTLLEGITDAAVAKKVHGALIYGVGNSEKNIYYLDHEAIEHSAVVDAYAMGYDACAEVEAKLESKTYKMQNRLVEYRVLRQNDLFLPENAQFLFTYD